MSTTDPTLWIKASRSGGNGNCVEMRQHDAKVEVRDTKQHGTGPTLRVSAAGFAAWIESAKNGELDSLS